jgi:hypothetical protein
VDDGPIVDRRVQLEFRAFVEKRWSEVPHKGGVYYLRPTIAQLEIEFQQLLEKQK